jgi:hypothetical protein
MKTINFFLLLIALNLFLSCTAKYNKSQKYNFDFNDKDSQEYYIRIAVQFDKYFNDNFFETDQKTDVRFFIFSKSEDYHKFRSEKGNNDKTDFFVVEESGNYIIAADVSKGIKNLVIPQVKFFIKTGLRKDTPQWISEGLEVFFEKFTGSLDSNGVLSIQTGYYNEFNYDRSMNKYNRSSISEIINNYTEEHKYDSGSLIVFMSQFDQFLSLFLKNFNENIIDKTGMETFIRTYNENYNNYCGEKKEYELKEIEQNFNCNLDRINFEYGYFFVKEPIIYTFKEMNLWFDSNKAEIYYDHEDNLFKRKVLKVEDAANQKVFEIIDDAINKSSCIRSISFTKQEDSSGDYKNEPERVKIKYPDKLKRVQAYKNEIIIKNVKWDLSNKRIFDKEFVKYYGWEFEAPIIYYDFEKYVEIAGDQIKIGGIEYSGENENEFILNIKDRKRKYFVNKGSGLVTKIDCDGRLTIFSEIEINDVPDSIFNIALKPGMIVREKIGDKHEYREYRIPYENNLTKQDSLTSEKKITEVMDKLSNLKSFQADYLEKHTREDNYDKSKRSLSEKRGLIKYKAKNMMNLKFNEQYNIGEPYSNPDTNIIIADGDSIYQEEIGGPFYSKLPFDNDLKLLKLMKRFSCIYENKLQFPEPLINFFGSLSGKSVVSFIDFITQPFDYYDKKNIMFLEDKNNLLKFRILKSEDNLETELYIGKNDGIVRKAIEYSDENSFVATDFSLENLQINPELVDSDFKVPEKSDKMNYGFGFSSGAYISPEGVFESFYNLHPDQVSNFDGGGIGIGFGIWYLLKFSSETELKLSEENEMDVKTNEYDQDVISSFKKLFPNDSTSFNSKEDLIFKTYETRQSNGGGLSLKYIFHKSSKTTYIYGDYSGM